MVFSELQAISEKNRRSIPRRAKDLLPEEQKILCYPEFFKHKLFYKKKLIEAEAILRE